MLSGAPVSVIITAVILFIHTLCYYINIYKNWVIKEGGGREKKIVSSSAQTGGKKIILLRRTDTAIWARSADSGGNPNETKHIQKSLPLAEIIFHDHNMFTALQSVENTAGEVNSTAKTLDGNEAQTKQ